MQKCVNMDECANSACPHFKRCDRIRSEVVYYGEAQHANVAFVHVAEHSERKVFDSPTGKVFRKLVDLVITKELKKSIGIAYIDAIRTPSSNFKTWDYCKHVFCEEISQLNPQLIVPVGHKATACVLNMPSLFQKEEKEFKEIRSILTTSSLTKGESPYQVLPILGPNRSYEMPHVIICSILEDLRRALGVYTFTPMKNETKIIELCSTKEVKGFVDYVVNDVKAEAIALDTEDKNLNRVYGNKLDSLQFCWDPKEAFFLWYSHPKTPFSPADLKVIKHELRRLFLAKQTKFQYWLMHNAKFDLHILLSQLKVRPVKPVICTMTFPFILEENYTDSPYGGFGLKHLSKKYGFKGFDNPEILNARKAGRLRDIPNDEFIKYATDDVVATVQLYDILKNMAKGQKYLDQSMKLMVNFFNRVYTFLVEMEHNGIFIDEDKLQKLSGPYSPINTEMNDIAFQKLKTSNAVQKANALLVKDTTTDVPLFGDPWIFNIDKVKHKQALFFGTLGLKPVSKGKITSVNVGGKIIDVGKMDKKFQGKYTPTTPEVQWLVAYQQLKKLKTSYIKSINKFLDPEQGYEDYYTDRMLRPQFSLMAKTGRARASKPNSQQIPKGNTDVRKEIRSIYCAPPGWAVISLDYMAVEVRVWGMLSEDKEMIKMFYQAKEYRDKWRGTNDPAWLRKAELYGNIHTVNASVLFDVSLEEVTKVMRDAVKAITFGTIYGMGFTSMAAQMGCSVDEAKRRRTKAFSKFKEAGAWLENIEKKANTDFYVSSPLGRRRRLWELILSDDNFLQCSGINPEEFENIKMHCARAKRQARNSPIQSLASDITFLSAALFFQNVILKQKKNWKFFNVVHDAVYMRVPIDEIKECVLSCEKVFTKDIVKLLEVEFNYKLPLPLEAEFEIGTDGGNLKKWNFSEEQLDEIVNEIKKLDAQKHIVKKNITYSLKGCNEL